MATPTESGRWVRLNELTAAGLSAEDAAKLVSAAMMWFGTAYALVQIHGRDRAAKRLSEIGCPVRFDDEGEPVIWANPSPKRVPSKDS